MSFDYANVGAKDRMMSYGYALQNEVFQLFINSLSDKIFWSHFVSLDNKMMSFDYVLSVSV